ncbi:hypothetical protein HME9304_03013 [Flagellimonas maritima]|uniref:Uncharacterized protein n=1 Tax=Flagellimonas maritima TaxID=1383885 RepID=A0A2Z4LVQ1_9FLAO|nr:hypothetical protein [Allomuricauda aurantiaca]AWX45981.1 hypothetical protein HME9304_03013 [Allomuricauda aurantiaca]
MSRYILTMTSLLFIFQMGFSQEIPSKEWQIETALMAVPLDYKKGAKVYGYDANGNFVSLREGTNDYIALASDPKKEKFSTAAYHKDLDPFMARGRELQKDGKDGKQIFDIREKEVKSGQLKMPDKSTLCVFTGVINSETKEIENPYVRYVFYIPFATGESTGLPTTPTPPGHAWIMDPGTHKAHIMITPPKSK